MAVKHRNPQKSKEKLTRKQQRKEKRQGKKVRRNEYYTNRKKPGQSVLNPTSDSSSYININQKIEKNGKGRKDKKRQISNVSTSQVLTTEQLRQKEKEKQKKIQKQMMKQRNKQLIEDNIDEDRNIKQLEKQLKLNKRKSKSIPKTFLDDGLDYLLEVCESDAMKTAVTAEQELNEVNDEFEEDFALMANKNIISENEDFEDFLNEDVSDDEDELDSELETLETEEYTANIDDENLSENHDNSSISDSEEIITKKLNVKGEKVVNKEELKRKLNDISDDIGEEKTYKNVQSAIIENCQKKNEEKYIPPAVRAKLVTGMPEDKKRLEKLNRLKRQLKGLLNRLAESNMHNIATQMEELYMNNSRNDMNDTLTNLMMESLISQVVTPERLLIEHIVLITVLHANVGTEVGAHFLQSIIKKFDEYVNVNQDVENKTLDNIVNIVSQLYNFKLFEAKLLYEILYKLSTKFEEKDVECILNILKSVGFTLRKDDPLALKNLILDLQKRAANTSEEVRDNPRVKFMLEILLAIKNNNVTKIPNYDTSYSERLKKLMKGFIRKGNYVTQLSISLEDLLKAEERGKWWVVGSAWTGNAPENKKLETSSKAEGFPEKLLELARKQRMNTDTRRNIFCIIMSAEDYLDAFEKLLRLSLKNQQEREIINVILHCCLQEKAYNPYYAVLAQKFCEFDRKYQMTIKCSIWDKLKSLDDHSGSQISNLAKMLTHLFLEKGLPISTLKIVQFSELDKVTLRFMRQILLGILLHKDEDSCLSVFENVAQSDKLKLFRESLRLFIHHFLLKNLKLGETHEHEKSLLEIRAKMVERVLMSKEGKMKF
ncbi:hypothetical protein NQ314_015215 [Rhamnusium bicolor]|uniref:MI domain-containing protein n=1 Tax=Rhamnusium bicolor TaxID=1586634 RepID=A0AAV8WZ67_9CUCU|nr:hypothetical protein NQ314_015215 [Rhamnusium bicolor]